MVKTKKFQVNRSLVNNFSFVLYYLIKVVLINSIFAKF